MRDLLVAIGENPERDGLKDTPDRVARAYEEIFAGQWQEPEDVLTTTFDLGHDEMVLVKDIEVRSMCVPSRQTVNAVGGEKRAADVKAGDQLWTLVLGETRSTTVTEVSSHQVRELVEVETERGTFRVTPDHPLATADGWREARDVAGGLIEWTHPRHLSRTRPQTRWSTGFATSVEPTVRPTGYLGRDALKNRSARTIVSANTAFLTDLATVIGARFTPRTETASALYVADPWMRKHGFESEYAENSKLIESEWVKVLDVRPVLAEDKKPFTVYSYRCEPHPTFLISGHLTHNCEHHLVPFFGVAHVGYIPSEDGRITGLSKLARLVDVFARRPQVQERLTTQVADSLMRILQPRGAIVVVECEHLCMSMRGIRKPGAQTITSAVRGQLRDPTTRAEAMSLIVARR